MIKNPITTPGKARGMVRIDNKVFLPRNLFLTKNIPAVVETAKAAKVVANDTRTVKTNVFMYLGFLIISRYTAHPLSPSTDAKNNRINGNARNANEKINNGVRQVSTKVRFVIRF